MVNISSIHKYYEAISTLSSGSTPHYVPYLNAFLALFSAYLVYRAVFPATGMSSDEQRAKDQAEQAPEPIVFTTFNTRSLQPFNGTDNERVLLAIKGRVYDVSSGRSFYGPGGPYSNFAGRDASRGLAKGSFDDDMLTAIEEPLDTLEDLTPEELHSLAEWEQHFTTKYILCGELVELQ
ncbi:cytochrome b5-like heme/steroid binding domain-containing protein [Limtongia smithiae]|uniref:cytochrome b5-like heme/steroid binding domain-containing protein n=1 Tax=Limtongia smithiae TaxID=1125753 RepID=UPI0034CF5751